MRKATWVVLCTFVFLVGVGSSFDAARAQVVLPHVVAVDVPGTQMVFMNLRVPQDGLQPHELRSLIWKRLSEVLNAAYEEGRPLDGRSVSVRHAEGAAPAIYVGSALIVSVDADHAALNASTQEQLASMWARNLSAALDRFAEMNPR